MNGIEPVMKTRGEKGRPELAILEGRTGSNRTSGPMANESSPSSQESQESRPRQQSHQDRFDEHDPVIQPKAQANRGRKRKRQAPSTRKSKVSRKTLSITSKETFSAPSVNDSTQSIPVLRNGTRVFAIWKNDKFYYPGIIIGPSPNSKTQYRVGYEGGDEALVNVAEMRQCIFKKGDPVDVLNNNKGIVAGGLVVDTEGWDDRGVVKVNVGEEVDVYAEHLCIPAREIAKFWEDRKFVVEEIPQASSPPPRTDVSTASTHGNARRNQRTVLPRTAFVITHSLSKGAPAQQEEALRSAISDGGGFVAKDWQELFAFQGTTVSVAGGKRWIGGKAGVKWIGDGEEEGRFEQVFVVTDRAVQSPQYLMALALGIPCVSSEWVKDRLRGNNGDWRSFILSAGYSKSLGAECSQWVDRHWGERPNQLAEIMSNDTVRRIFVNKSVLCVGNLFQEPESGHLYAQLVCAMGAVRVEVVAEVAQASDKTLTSFDFVIVDPPNQIVEGIASAGVEWLKDCLISGRVVPLE